MSPKLIQIAIDAAALIAVVLVGWIFLSWFGGKAVDTISAPAKLDAALGNNAALAKGADAQNKGVDALVADGAKRKTKSEAAVKSAGSAEFAAAKRLQETKAAGDTPIARAANRINAEFAR